MKIRTVILIISFIMVHSHIFADTIYLKNGRKIEGRIINTTERGVRVDIAAGEMIVNNADIKKIEKNNNNQQKALSAKSSTGALKAGQAVSEKEDIIFTVPPKWKLLPSTAGCYGFSTGKNSAQNPSVYIRKIGLGKQTAMQWIKDEEEYHRSNGMEAIIKPEAVVLGNLKWTILELKGTAKNSRGQTKNIEGYQYYTNAKSDKTLLEVVIFERENMSNKIDRKEFETFLSSFKFKEK